MKIDRNIIMKKLYNQPEVQVAQIALESMVLAGSPAPSGGTMDIHTDIPGNQW